KDDFLLKPGTVAPLVLDSPLGQLDRVYQEETARYVPTLAPQVVLLVSSTQGNERVLDALGSHIGAEYALISENHGKRGDKKPTYLKRGGKEIETTLYGCEKTLTRIERLK
ncbi:MAG: hypothetical protein PHR77_12445, partial [Kiritimatiellae bacterium]|nr:hypothetical protein [Kiritimatiellia bacterium]